MQDIAAHAKVSVGTVSHVLNETATVREVLKKRVLQPSFLQSCGEWRTLHSNPITGYFSVMLTTT
jgi:hypothetical protein